ncbi:Uncharacterised protein [Starkeya nomas]|uniref:Uncharacterized protein n=1 Tax=Starkeya nomas TaxID=2666134 RepID=A0A5S9NA14_9HYPH|nr:hypothetical protein [Starkeya nomas]CAA0086972.1 Uncharacterised protein [Starkeya nomas]
MKALTLEDLSREELLAWIKASRPWRIRQVDLLSVRHTTLCAKSEAALRKWLDACSAETRAFQAWLAHGEPRERNRLELIYLNLKDEAQKAERASKRADREQKACWAAMEAEWSRDRE